MTHAVVTEGPGAAGGDAVGLPFVSVVIPAYNRRELLAQALDGLERQTYPAERMEVIVVDNGSDDGTIDELARRTPPWRLRGLRFERNHTPAEARNTGLAVAAGEVVAFTDSDCVPSPEWIDRGVAAFAPGVGVVQGKTLPDPGADRPAGWCATQSLEQFTGRYETCNVFYRTIALRRIGGFPEDLGFFGEDTVAGWAVRRLGFGDRFAEEAVVHHAVVYPGFRWFMRRAQLYRNWSTVVKRCPEVRREVLWCRVFLRSRNACFLGALLGTLLAPWRPGALLLGLPYARLRLSLPLTAGKAKGIAQSTLHDAVIFYNLARGSVRERCLVL